MRLSCFQDLIDVGFGIEPVKERPHVGGKTFRLRRLKMDFLFSDGTGDDFHRTGAVVAPCPGSDFLVMPLRPVGNRDACQAKSLSSVSGLS